MRFAVSAQQRTYFQKHGEIVFEDLLSPKEIKQLKAGQDVVMLIRKRQLAQIAFELTGERPLRLVRIEQTNLVELQEQECALLFSLETSEARYTNQPLYKGEEACYLVIVFTSRYLDDAKHPVVHRYD